MVQCNFSKCEKCNQKKLWGKNAIDSDFLIDLNVNKYVKCLTKKFTCGKSPYFV